MKLLICMDDTDNLESPGTGHLVEEFRSRFSSEGWGETEPISRHQLFVHPQVPYTSHNSTMCFAAYVNKGMFYSIRDRATSFLKEASAPGSDPGLAMAFAESLVDWDKLIRFGRGAQKKVLTKKEAYSLAEDVGIHLSEHGGTGDGVIGALAGIGLRLSGNDGRIRGKLEGLVPGQEIRVGELMAHKSVDSVIAVDPHALPVKDSAVILNDYLVNNSQPLDPSEKIVLRDKVKCIYRFHQAVFLVCREEGQWTNWTKDQLKVF